MRKVLRMHKSIAALCVCGVLLTLSTTASGDAAKVHSFAMQRGAESTSFVISKIGAAEVEEFLMEDPPRLVVDLMGATNQLIDSKFDGDGMFVKKVRCSQFTNEPDGVTRVVFDLTGEVGYDITQTVDAVTVRFYGKDNAPASPPPARATESAEATMKGSVAPMGMADLGGSTKVQPQRSPDQADKPADTQTMAKADKPAASQAPSWTAPADKQSPSEWQGKTAKPEAPANTNWTAPTTVARNDAAPNSMASGSPSIQSFAASNGLVRNKNITLDVQNADIRTVLRSMSEFGGTNIISGPEVTGKVTAHLKQVPWRQALDIILKAHGFGWREEYGVIRVSTLERLTKEELELQTADRQKDQLLPLQTKIIPLSYANADEMKNALKEIMTDRGSMEIEAGTNALVVTDIQRTVDQIEMMVADLDRKIKQVEIVAKLVDVDYEATREMGVHWDALNLNVDGISGIAQGVVDAPTSNPVGQFRIGTVQSWGELQATIDLLERQQKANIISNPRIVTADNREASILVGKEIPLIVSDEAGNPITELTKVGIVLRVTPHVNLDNTVTMDLHPEVSELSSQATVQGGIVISLSEADTRVVVGDGETAVIGGLINEVESSLDTGVPVLMDIPIIGNFFKSSSKTKKKRELIIFVTPRIVDGMAANN